VQSIDSADGPARESTTNFAARMLRTYDGTAQNALAELDGHVDVDPAREIWTSALDARWDGVESWFHGPVRDAPSRAGGQQAEIRHLVVVSDPDCSAARPVRQTYRR